MFAVIKTGGQQYRVAEDEVIRVGKLKGEPGEIVQIYDVMMVGGDKPQLGSPVVSGASVAVEMIEQSRGPKVIAFKKRRRKNSRRKRGHRQDFTLVRISEILTDGKSPRKRPRVGRHRNRRPRSPRARKRRSPRPPSPRKSPRRPPKSPPPRPRRKPRQKVSGGKTATPLKVGMRPYEVTEFISRIVR